MSKITYMLPNELIISAWRTPVGFSLVPFLNDIVFYHRNRIFFTYYKLKRINNKPSVVTK